MDPGTALLSISLLLLLAPAILLAYALLTDDPDRDRLPALPSDYRPEANHPRPGMVPDRCSNCGAENDVEYEYCRECGSELDDDRGSRAASLEELFDAE